MTTDKPTEQSQDRRRRGAAALEFAGRYRGVLAFVVVFLLGILFSPASLKTGHSTFLNWSLQNDILFEYASLRSGAFDRAQINVVLASDSSCRGRDRDSRP